MIVRLSGKIEFVGEDCVHVGIGDMTHELMIPAADIPFLQAKIGQHVSFFTVEYLEGNPSFGSMAPKMLGFLRAEDKSFFELFTTVKGIGTKKALKAFAIPISQIAVAIALKDTRKLATLPQIGKRAAEQIIAELHGKVEKFATGATPAIPIEKLPDHEQGAIAALVTLGEKRNEAENWVRRACDADPSLKDPNKILVAVYRLKNGGR